MQPKVIMINQNNKLQPKQKKQAKFIIKIQSGQIKEKSGKKKNKQISK